MVYRIKLLNTVLEIEDFYYKSESGVATVYEDLKLKSFHCNNNREQTRPIGSSSYSVCSMLHLLWLILLKFVYIWGYPST